MKSPTRSWPRSASGIENGRPVVPQMRRRLCSTVIARPKVNSRPEHRVLAVEPLQEQPLDRHADQRHADRRQHHRAAESGALLDLVGEVGADRVEGAVREVDHAAQAEDHRQPEREDDVVRADQQAVDDLLEDRSPGRCEARGAPGGAVMQRHGGRRLAMPSPRRAEPGGARSDARVRRHPCSPGLAPLNAGHGSGPASVTPSCSGFPLRSAGSARAISVGPGTALHDLEDVPLVLRSSPCP